MSIRLANRSGGFGIYVELDISAVGVENVPPAKLGSEMCDDVDSASADIQVHLRLPRSPATHPVMSILGVVSTFRRDDLGSTCGYCSPAGQRSAQALSFHDAELGLFYMECEVYYPNTGRVPRCSHSDVDRHTKR